MLGGCGLLGCCCKCIRVCGTHVFYWIECNISYRFVSCMMFDISSHDARIILNECNISYWIVSCMMFDISSHDIFNCLIVLFNLHTWMQKSSSFFRLTISLFIASYHIILYYQLFIVSFRGIGLFDKMYFTMKLINLFYSLFDSAILL